MNLLLTVTGRGGVSCPNRLNTLFCLTPGVPAYSSYAYLASQIPRYGTVLVESNSIFKYQYDRMYELDLDYLHIPIKSGL